MRHGRSWARIEGRWRTTRRSLMRSTTAYSASASAVFITKLDHEFHETGRNEAGIDGFMELRELPSGRAQGQVIACQVKFGTSDISEETGEGFTRTASKGDLSYWENSN
jgi:hypothetical protein